MRGLALLIFWQTHNGAKFILHLSFILSQPLAGCCWVKYSFIGCSLDCSQKLLTPAGLLHGWLLGVLIWGSLGWRGYLVVLFYFLVGSAATRIGLAQKEAEGIAEKRSGARGPENVWGSALTGTLCALGTLAVPVLDRDTELITYLLLLGYVASFTTKLSDTCASEVGKAYGKRTFLITTLQPVARGTEGAVSLEGTLAGVVASAAIALVGWGVGLIDLLGVVWCILQRLLLPI